MKKNDNLLYYWIDAKIWHNIFFIYHFNLHELVYDILVISKQLTLGSKQIYFKGKLSYVNF